VLTLGANRHDNGDDAQNCDADIEGWRSPDVRSWHEDG
jgi:hypothetical protein